MRIAFIGQKGIPMTFGGVEKHVEEMATRLTSRGHEVVVYTRPNYTDKGLTKFKGVELVSCFAVATKHLDAISHTFFSVLDVIFKRKVDIVHFHSIGPSFLIPLVRIFRPRMPIIATFHSQCYCHKKWGWFARTSLRIGECSCCLFSDSLITVSKELKQYAEKKYGCDASYVPNGVPLYDKISADKIKQKWGLETDEYILVVARLLRVKGLHYLIEAFNKTNTYKKLVIVGDSVYTDDYVKQLKKMAKSNKRIIFTGRQNGRELAELFSNAYLYVSPSDLEGMPIAVLEAMSYELPVLMSDISGNRATVGDTGIVFKKGRTDDLQKKLQFALDNPVVTKNKGKRGRKRVERFFEWRQIIEQTERIYREAQEKNVQNFRILPRMTFLKKVVLRLFL